SQVRTPILEARNEDRNAREDERLASSAAADQPPRVKRIRRWRAAASVLRVDRELLGRHRQCKQCSEKRTPRAPCRPTEELSEHVLVVERLQDVHSAASLCSRA